MAWQQVDTERVMEIRWSFGVLVEDINPGTGSSSPANLIVYNGLLCFSAFVPGIGVELFTITEVLCR
jgi:hypothetical protein